MNNIESSGMDESGIAQYLLKHPEFFENHAELLSNIQLCSGHGERAISLQERQAQMLREKIKGLEQRIMEMVRNSSENAVISHKVHRWSCALAAVQDARQLPVAVADGIQKEFDVPQVALRVWNVAAPYADSIFTKGVSDDAKVFTSSLTTPFCGPNLGVEPTKWLAQPDKVQSVALMALREGNNDSQTTAFGLLVLGSYDPLRFDASMGTEFLARIAEQASAALSRLRVVPASN